MSQECRTFEISEATRSSVTLFGFCLTYLFVICLMNFPDSLYSQEVKTSSIRFSDITESAGITFRHYNGAFGKKYMPETMGSGVCFIDFDNDDYQDILFINGMGWQGHKPTEEKTMALYKNLGNGKFIDITQKVGLDIEVYGMGCSVADYDNDGLSDIFVTALGQDYLFRNNGGRDGQKSYFSNVTKKTGVDDDSWSTGSAWFDYDRDGHLDLFVGNYVEWSIETDIWCTLDGVNKAYCTPESYPGATPRLYHNNGDGTFQDATMQSGIYNPNAKTLGIVVFDYNEDGWLDIAVANDTEPDYLYQNNTDGTFSEVGLMSGMAFSETGKARAGMGMDVSDYDNSGKASLIVGNFSGEMIGVYHNEGNGLFVDFAPLSDIGTQSLPFLTFGLFFFDYDLNGRDDIFAVNGHVEDRVSAVQENITYAQRPLLFRNDGNSIFKEVGEEMVGTITRSVVGRGAAYADIDNDGDLDVLLTVNNGKPRLLRNDGGDNNWIRFEAIGRESNRSAIGTKVKVQTGDTIQYKMIKAGSSYCSQSELLLTFGLGKSEEVDFVEIFWPNGAKEELRNLKANQHVILKEGEVGTD